MPRPTARMAERKSPKPSMESTAASSNPDGIECARDVRSVMADVVDRGIHRAPQSLREVFRGPARLGEVGGPVERLAQEPGALEGVPDLLQEEGVRVAGEGDVVDLVRPDATLLQHDTGGEEGEPGTVLLPVETLLLDGGDEQPVLHEGGGGVGVVGVESEDDHVCQPSYGMGFDLPGVFPTN